MLRARGCQLCVAGGIRGVGDGFLLLFLKEKSGAVWCLDEPEESV
jgi:hypothetical protein